MTGSPAPETTRRWWAAGEQAVVRLVAGLSDDDLAGPSALRDWTRADVVAHLARNADALCNLLEWARTGVEKRMYPSREERDAGIAASAALPPEELRADHAAASQRFVEAVTALPPDAWTAGVRTMQDRPVPATEVPWMRAKEMWVHGVDLAAGMRFGDLPTDFCTALVDDVLGLFVARGDELGVTVVATDVDRSWGAGPEVSGPVSAVAAWVTRSDASGLAGDVPAPPRWL